MSDFFRAMNVSLSKILPEQTLVIRSNTDQRELTFSPVTRLGLLFLTTIVVVWFVIASVATISIGFDSGSAEARNEALQDAYEQRLAELATERDAFAVRTQAMQNRFALALEQVSAQQDELIDAMTVQNEQRITLYALQRKLNAVTAERNAAQVGLDGLQAEFAAMTDGNGPRESSETELTSTLMAMNSVLEDAVKTRDGSIAYTEELQMQIADTEQGIRLNAQRRDRMLGQLEDAVQMSFSPLERMFDNVGLDVDSLLANVRRNYSGSGGLGGTALFTETLEGMDATDLRLQRLMQELDTVQMLNIAGTNIPMIMPVRTATRMSSPYGMRNGKMHKGVDMAGPTGTPLYATADGTVIFAGWQSGYGKVVKIQHDFGYVTVYAHQNKIHVTKGQRVSRGERIGDMGNTGRSSGPHVHYEIQRNGTAVNPMTYIKAGQNVY